MSDLKITKVRANALGVGQSQGQRSGEDPWLCTPLTQFSDFPARAADYSGPVSVVVVQVETDAGITGVGTAGAGNAGTLGVINHHFGPLVTGQDPFQVELLWSKMYRSSSRFGRRGVAIAALSAIDIALYDIMGKALGVPVYELLGGRSKEEVTVYASKLYALKDLEQLAEEAREYKKQGFRMMKQRFGFGPSAGTAGVKGNIALIKRVREEIGDDIELAADAYMGWDFEYAVRMERLLRPYDLKWIEEPLMPHDVWNYQRLCEVSETPISHGEHSYTRWDFAELIRNRAANILQPDVNRVGGITEARKIFALGAAHDLPVVPHSNELHNLHLVFSQLNTPFSEYFPNAELDSNTLFWHIFDGNPVAKNGSLSLDARPGLGYSLRQDVLERLTLEL
jgi:L-rhamnonate dehydratase